MPDKYSVDRKVFDVAGYNIIAKRFREALTPVLSPEKNTAEDMAIRWALVNLCIEFAKRFQIDNSEFDPYRFLDGCSPDPENYPLSELWDDTSAAKKDIEWMVENGE